MTRRMNMTVVGLVSSPDKGIKSHDIIHRGLEVLENMSHRGAESADNVTGDGAGIMIQIPHKLILAKGVKVPAEGKYATGLVFLPRAEGKECLRKDPHRCTGGRGPGCHRFH